LDGADEQPRDNWRGGGREGTPTDPEGVARFEHLKPGTYSFRVLSDDEGGGGAFVNTEIGHVNARYGARER
jgi:protocatechuate 3,4-dioxygenase beta subunit